MTALRPLWRSAVQRRAARFRPDIRVDAEVQAHLHGFEVCLRRPLVRDALHPADACRDRKAVTLLVVAIFGSAPRASNNLISAMSLDWAARKNGVAPSSSAIAW